MFAFSFFDNHCDCCLSEDYVYEDLAYGEFEALFKYKSSTQDCPGADTTPDIPYPEPEPDYASMSVRELRGIAAEHGADPEAIELARDSDDPVQELTLLITKQRRARVQGP